MHIGKKIREVLENRGMKQAELARRINTSPQNVRDIFQRETVDISLLRKIGDVLDYDFILPFSKVEEPEAPYFTGKDINEQIEFYKATAEFAEKRSDTWIKEAETWREQALAWKEEVKIWREEAKNWKEKYEALAKSTSSHSG